jgi:hypothetical protein
MGAGLARPVVSIRMWSNWSRRAHRLLSALTRSSRTWAGWWVCGCVGVWVCGCVGVWVKGRG